MSRFVRPFKLSRLILASAGLLLLLANTVMAGIIYTATLDGPTSGTASAATGTAIFTLNAAATEVSYVVEVTGLEGVEVGAHIHNGGPGALGPRLHTFLFGSPKVGTWAVGEFEVNELNDGRVYINVHTDLYPGGEIRGDLEFTSVANEAFSWGSIKALYQ